MMTTLKVGDIIHVSTNYELLNNVIGTNYNGYMQTIHTLDNNKFIWMIAIDGQLHKGWRNFFDGLDIIEEYLGGKPYPKNIYTGYTHKVRIVFEKIEQFGRRCFLFRGIYQLSADSILTHRVLNMVSDNIVL